MADKLRVRFSNIGEIRMGSPYNVCDVSFYGDWIPSLPTTDWQDIKATSPDKKKIALVLWNATGNIPGFHIIRIDIQSESYHKTKRILGLCKKLYWEDGQFKWEKAKLF
jgi:hypothetical protein